MLGTPIGLYDDGVDDELHEVQAGRGLIKRPVGKSTHAPEPKLSHQTP